MKYLVLVCLMIHNFCYNSFVDSVVLVKQPSFQQQNLFDDYKKAFAAYFYQKAVAQHNQQVATCCGEYGFGKNWQHEIDKVTYPQHLNGQHCAIACQVAQDMTEKLSDIADWLKQNAH